MTSFVYKCFRNFFQRLIPPATTTVGRIEISSFNQIFIRYLLIFLISFLAEDDDVKKDSCKNTYYYQQDYSIQIR